MYQGETMKQCEHNVQYCVHAHVKQSCVTTDVYKHYMKYEICAQEE